jgi:nucleoside-diphosphate-sugar epimerase
MGDKPNVLVLGGVGFIGRNFVKYLVDNNLASRIVVVDKVLPATGFLNEDHQKVFENPIVEFKQSNLSKPAAVKSIFEAEATPFKYVFNLAGETKYGQSEDLYKERVLDLSVACATEAKTFMAGRFIEVSTAQVYESDKKPSKETDKTKPWTTLAKYKLQAEEALKGISGLSLVIVRPATVYGPADVNGLAPRVIAGAVYSELKEKMECLWGSDLKVNTVHVADVVKALWFLAEKGHDGEIYNLADSGATDQAQINECLEAVFGIKTGFIGTALSLLANVNLKAAAEEVNDKHMKPWIALCKRHGISHTPLTAYIDPEVIAEKQLSVDGTKITTLGFKYDHPKLTPQGVQEIIDYFSSQNLFPKLK